MKTNKTIRNNKFQESLGVSNNVFRIAQKFIGLFKKNLGNSKSVLGSYGVFLVVFLI